MRIWRQRKALLLVGIMCLAVAASGTACSCEARVPAPEGFSVKDGRVFRNGTALECEVYPVPDGIENGITFWSVVGSEMSDAVKAEETGVLFFGPEGALAEFLPLDSESEYQDLIWSPDGGRFILATGGDRPDVTFTLYGEGMKKGKEFSGLRGAIEWADPLRFVYTRIDDVREGAVAHGRSFWFRFSVVLYDAPADLETVLKEATDTQNFILISVSDDDVSILEKSVKSVKDWSDEDKIFDREISVPIPAAG